MEPLLIPLAIVVRFCSDWLSKVLYMGISPTSYLHLHKIQRKKWTNIDAGSGI